MTELEKLIKTAVYGSVGAIATIAEKSGELLQVFVDKGEEVVRQGQTVTEEAVKKFKEVWEEADIDVSRMNQEQREALRRRLEELAKAERRAAVDEQQQIKEQIQHEMDVMSARLDELTKANADSEQQKKKLQSTIDEYEARVSVAENWMRSLEAEQYRSEAKKLEKYLDSLNSVRRRIEVEWNSRWAKSRELQTSEELQPSRILREDMSGIRSRLHAYQEELTRVIRLLGSREVRS